MPGVQKRDRPIPRTVAGLGRSDSTAPQPGGKPAGAGTVYLKCSGAGAAPGSFPWRRSAAHRLRALEQEHRQGQRDGLGGGEGRPHAVHAKQGAQDQRAGDDGGHAPADRGDGGLGGAVDRTQIARRNNIAACKEVAQEVDAHTAVGIFGHQSRALAVEEGNKGIGKAKHGTVQHRRQRQRSAAAQQKQPFCPGHLIFAVALADQRLGTLGHAVEDGCCHQRKVCHHAVSGHAHVARQPEQQEVEHGGGHGRGELPDKTGDAQLAALHQQPDRGGLPDKGERVALLKEVAAADGDAEHRRDGRCQRRAGQAQPHGEDENVIEHHIEQAAAQGGHHGKGRVAVVADEGREDVVAHEERREQQEDAGVVQAQGHDVPIAAHELQKRARAERACQHERDGDQAGAEDGVGKIPLRPRLALRLQDGVPGGRTQTDHRAEGKDQVVHGQTEVQQGHAVGARRLRDEIGVGQNITRCADQTENILRHILEELLCQVHGSFLSAGRVGE